MKTVECERKSVDVQFCPDLGPERSRLRFLHDFVNYFDVPLVVAVLLLASSLPVKK